MIYSRVKESQSLTIARGDMERVVNNAERLVDGQALYSVMCREDGLIEDDVIVMRFSAEHIRIIT